MKDALAKAIFGSDESEVNNPNETELSAADRVFELPELVALVVDFVGQPCSAAKLVQKGCYIEASDCDCSIRRRTWRPLLRVNSTFLAVVAERVYAHFGLEQKQEVIWNEERKARRLLATLKNSPRKELYSSCVRALGLKGEDNTLGSLLDDVSSVLEGLGSLLHLSLDWTQHSIGLQTGKDVLQAAAECSALKYFSLRGVNVNTDAVCRGLTTWKYLRRFALDSFEVDRDLPLRLAAAIPTGLETVVIKGRAAIFTAESVVVLFGKLADVQSLTLDIANDDCVGAIARHIGFAKNLQKLDIRDFRENGGPVDDIWGGVSAPSLKSVAIGASFSEQADLDALGEVLSRLTSVDDVFFYRCNFHDNLDLEPMFAALPPLRKLSFFRSAVGIHIPDIVQHLSKVTELAITWDEVYGAELEALGLLTKLVTLDLRDSEWSRKEMIQTLRKLTRLRRLDVTAERGWKDRKKWVAAVKKWSPRLQIFVHEPGADD